PPTNAMNSRRFMCCLNPRIAAYHSVIGNSALCITASWAAQCLSWVKLGHSATSAQCLVCPKADAVGRFMSTRPRWNASAIGSDQGGVHPTIRKVTSRKTAPRSHTECRPMATSSADIEQLILELSASLVPPQRSAFDAAARAALAAAGCSGCGAAYRVLAPLQRAYFDPPDDQRTAHVPRHNRSSKLIAAEPIVGPDPREG